MTDNHRSAFPFLAGKRAEYILLFIPMNTSNCDRVGGLKL